MSESIQEFLGHSAELGGPVTTGPVGVSHSHGFGVAAGIESVLHARLSS